MLYAVVLLAHSWLRWLVVAVALWVLVASLRAKQDWQVRDQRRAAALVGLADLQMTLGLALWLWLSPIAAAAWRGGFGEPVLLVFGIVHPALMIVATVVLHAGHGRLAHAPSERKHRRLASTVVAWLAIAALAIPWPGLPWGRPLGRVEPPPTADDRAPAAPAAWARCVSCHGATGRGDGPAALGMSPRPRSFADRAWQARATDTGIRRVIRTGGATVGLSAVMPAHTDLSETELAELVSFIRTIADEPTQDRKQP